MATFTMVAAILKVVTIDFGTLIIMINNFIGVQWVAGSAIRAGNLDGQYIRGILYIGCFHHEL